MNEQALERYCPVFYRIQQILPGAIIAGGFLRDTLLDKIPTDIDIFVDYSPQERQLAQLDSYLGTDFMETSLCGGSEGEEYIADSNRTSFLQELFESETSDLHLGVDICVVCDPFVHVAEFPDGTSRVYFTQHGLYCLPEFTYGHGRGVIQWFSKPSDARWEKINKKFPTYTGEIKYG